ncbi:MAG TPA: GtrA family protein [Xanthomonadales bacterium]|nr:GtrA family protein [Xanthomonadales bacterium]
MALIRQGFWFVLIGGLQVLADWAAFVALTALGVAVAPSNIAARAVGASLGFWLNGKITFAQAGEQRLGGRRFGRYLLAWIAFTLLSTGLVATVASRFSLEYAWLAKPVVEGGLALLSFATARYWIYR